MAYYKKNLFNQALWILKKILSKAPDNPLINFHMAKVLYAMGGNTSAAISNLNKAISLNLESPYKKEAEALLQKLQNLMEKTDDSEPPESPIISPDLDISDLEKLPWNNEQE